MIYFLIGIKTRLIKIGFTQEKNLNKRMSELRCANADDLELLGIIPQVNNSNWTEHLLHIKFEDHHVRGEWFREDQEILDFIETNTIPPVKTFNPRKIRELNSERRFNINRNYSRREFSKFTTKEKQILFKIPILRNYSLKK